MFRHFSLPIKFSLFSLLMTLTGVAIALSVTFYHSNTLLRQQALERLSDDVEREQAMLDTHLKTLTNDINFVARGNALQGVIRATLGNGYDDEENMTTDMWQSRLVDLFDTILRQRTAYNCISLVTFHPSGHGEIRVQRLNRSLTRFNGLRREDENLRETLAQTATLAEGEYYISPVFLERRDGLVIYPPRSMLRIATPIYNDGDIYGVVSITVSFDDLLYTLYNAPEHMQYFLTNAQGDYLIHPDPSRRLAFLLGPSTQESALKDYSALLSHPSDNWQLLQRYLPESKAGVTLKRYQFEGAQLGDTEFWLGAQAELALLSTESDALKEQIILLALLIILGVTLGTIMIGRLITRPILKLRDAADRITAGEADVELNVKGQDEVASLAQSLGTMLEHIRTSQDDLARLNRSLEDKVRSRTIELENAKTTLEGTNEELARALQEAEQAAVAKSQFLANMSHEIRTPLNGVLGMAELLMNTPMDDRQQGYLETVKTSGNTLLNLLNDILDFSKLEAGKLNLSEVKFNPNDVVEHSLQLFVELANNKGLELIPMTMPTLPNLLIGDPDRLGQVLMNLVSNAIKFTEEGEVVLGVHCQHETSDGMRLRFSVKDTGIGIDKEQQARLFEKFVQADGTSTRKHGGTGLGLAISKQLVDLMGGDIQLESTPGEGTTIWFEIELKKGPEQKQADDAQRMLAGKRVLVVDDNKTNRDLLNLMTESWGMLSTQAADASTALHQMTAAADKGQPFELILTDHMMPGKSGLELAQEIARNPEFKRPPVLLLTSISDQLSEHVLANAGVCSMMTKPLRQSHLYNHIVHCLEGVSHAPAQTIVTTKETPPIRHATASECRLLLVEDTPLNQRVALGMLNTLGYQAELVCNGKQAVDQVCAEQFDLVLMDIEMPVKDGLQATREIRAWEAENSQPGTPIVALTAHALKGDRDKCLAAGMNDYLSKPLTMDALQGCLEQWLLEATGEPPSAQEHTETVPAEAPVTETQVTLDSEVLAQLRAGLGDDIDDVLHIFLQEWPELLSGLQHHLDAEEPDQLRMLAHRLKGSCRNLGASQPAALAQQIEQAAASNILSEVPPLIRQLKTLESATETAVRAQLSTAEV